MIAVHRDVAAIVDLDAEIVGSDAGTDIALIKVEGDDLTEMPIGDSEDVRVGDFVEKGQVLCIVEAMKLMNEIEAEVSGRVVEVCVQNAQPVEFGQVLFKVDPAG